jgi:hypothetical protein
MTSKTKSKTIKIAAFSKDEFERIKIEPTKMVNIDNLNISSKSLDDELANLSRSELEYRLKYEATDSIEREKIKHLLKEMK